MKAAYLYLRSYPRVTAIYLVATAILAIIGFWPWGSEGIVRGALASVVMALALKLMLVLLVLFHTRSPEFGRQIAPLGAAIFALLTFALVVMYPILERASAMIEFMSTL